MEPVALWGYSILPYSNYTLVTTSCHVGISINLAGPRTHSFQSTTDYADIGVSFAAGVPAIRVGHLCQLSGSFGQKSLSCTISYHLISSHIISYPIRMSCRLSSHFFFASGEEAPRSANPQILQHSSRRSAGDRVTDDSAIFQTVL